MSALKVGELFAGYGGLGLGLAQVLETETAWVSDIDKGANKILAHRYPDVPNLGDLTAIDWAAVEPVDIITGGFPCQDLSHAGKGAGMAAGTRSGLWSYMAEAIDKLRPRLVAIENVRGLLSAEALRPVEPCTWCVGDEPVFDVRALGAVLADLADIGYDASWYGLPASRVGACHRRFREFIVAYPRGQARHVGPGLRTDEQAGHGWRQPARSGGPTGLNLLPSPRATDGTKGGPNQRGSSGDLMLPSAVTHLLPTPAVNDMGKAYTPDEWDAWTAKMQAAHGNGNGHGKSLEIEAARLLPTPTTTQRGTDADAATREGAGPNLHNAVAAFGQYANAIGRWESVIGRPAPAPTEPTGKGGAHRLSPAFTEWMMGLPAGWITDVPNITRNEALKALGNGVVPAQAAAALRHLLAASEATR